MARQASELAAGSSARARFIWISPYKVREVTALIKGKHIDEARRILAFTPKAASRLVAKVLESAVANAEHNYQIPQEELVVKAAWADEGPVFKRSQPRARGARNMIRRRTCHIHVALERIRRPEPAVPRRARTAPAEAAPKGETKEPKVRRRRSSKSQEKPKAPAARKRRPSGGGE